MMLKVQQLVLKITVVCMLVVIAAADVRAFDGDAGVDEPSAGVSSEKASPTVAEIASPLVWVQRLNGKVETIKERDLYSCCPSCVRYGSMYYESVAEANKLVAQSCASMSKGKSARVSYRAYDKCSVMPFLDIDTYRNNLVQYSIWNDGVIHVSYNLRLNFSSKFLGDKITDTVLEETRACAERIKKFWGRYGLDVRVNVDSERRPAYTPDLEVMLHYHAGRSNTSEFYWDTQSAYTVTMRRNCKLRVETVEKDCMSRLSRPCRKMCIGDECVSNDADYYQLCLRDQQKSRREDFCLTMLHETGHHLGLPDEYEDLDACPARDTVSTESDPTSVMNDQSLGWKAIEFFPRHLNTVLKPLCGN